MKLRSAVAALTALLCACALQAQDYPAKPVRIVLVAVPGSAPDTVARVLSPEMAKGLGQPMVIENMPGAGGLIAYRHVAHQAAPDGYTTMLVSMSNLAILPLITRDLGFDPLKDIPPVIGLTEGLSIIGTSTKNPWKSFNELIAHAKANPGKLNYGTSSPALRFPMLLLLQELGLDVVHVPYKTGAQYTTALGSGEVQLGFVSEGAALGLKDRFRALAVTGNKRSPKFPDAPTFTELGHPRMPGLDYALNVPARTPRPIVDKLYAAASQALQQAEVKARLAKIGLEVAAEPGERIQKNLLEQARMFADIAKKAGIEPQ